MVKFRLATVDDLPYITELYNYYIRTSTATFHTEPLKPDDLRKYLPFEHPVYRTFLILEENQLVGFCYIGNYKPRQAYDRTAEVTIYLHRDAQGKGIGKQSLMFLEDQVKNTYIKNLMGVICADNESSMALFAKSGFQKVAHFHQVGEKFGRILDVVVYQKDISSDF